MQGILLKWRLNIYFNLISNLLFAAYFEDKVRKFEAAWSVNSKSPEARELKALRLETSKNF